MLQCILEVVFHSICGMHLVRHHDKSRSCVNSTTSDMGWDLKLVLGKNIGINCKRKLSIWTISAKSQYRTSLVVIITIMLFLHTEC